jgi:lysozyme family protein
VPTLSVSMKSEYQLLFDSCLIRPERLTQVSATASQVAAGKARYQAVAQPLGIPWYVVGLIHAMESGLDFTRHLHNGDPLTARTTHWPPGRPAAGAPPFTWEESATDALTMQGLPKWQDWSLPGVLYQLEGYNGFGYRNRKPPVPSPYLWSFSNHYTCGKYVADGKFSPSAVSQQCGAAVLLRRLAQSGAVQVATAEPRTLELTDPHMTGADVAEAQRLLAANPFGDFEPGAPDGDFGPITAAAVQRAKLALGYPDGAVDGSFGPTRLPKAHQALRAEREKGPVTA